MAIHVYSQASEAHDRVLIGYAEHYAVLIEGLQGTALTSGTKVPVPQQLSLVLQKFKSMAPVSAVQKPLPGPNPIQLAQALLHQLGGAVYLGSVDFSATWNRSITVYNDENFPGQILYKLEDRT